MVSQKVQDLIHKMEVGGGARFLRHALLVVLVVALAVTYDLRAYHGFAAPEAMDAAQVARNLAEGHGFSTDFIRPFSLYLVQKHNLAVHPGLVLSTNLLDPARVQEPHPDLANPPVYPLLLAGLMKAGTPDWQVETRKPFWSDDGHFMRYQPEFRIALLNQILLLAAAALTYFLARKLFDGQAAWLASLLVLGSDQLWQFSVSGLPTMLLLVILLGLAFCLVKAEELGRAEMPGTGRLAALAAAAGLLAGLGMLTRYSFGMVILPTAVFLLLFGGARRVLLVLAALVSFALVVSPWVARNQLVSGTFFGTAGYTFTGETFFPGSELMRSINPNLAIATGVMPYAHKFFSNLDSILRGGLWQPVGGWLGVLFFSGLLLGLRNLAARRLRYFTVMCLAILVFAEALGKPAAPGSDPENLLVLLLPLAAVFGTVFFLTLLDQMKLPAPGVRYGVIAVLFALVCQPLAANMLARNNPVSYPPYYPPEIQQVAGWMSSDEPMMSDVPWAVAWYGRRPCVWLTRNAQADFFAISDYYDRYGFQKPIGGIYLTTLTMDEQFLSEMARGNDDSWGHFIFNAGARGKMPAGFPLQAQKVTAAGLFLADRPRWPAQ